MTPRRTPSGLVTLLAILSIAMAAVCPRTVSALPGDGCPLAEVSCCDGACCCCPLCDGCGHGADDRQPDRDQPETGDCDCPLCGLSSAPGPSPVLDQFVNDLPALPPVAWSRPVRDDPRSYESASDILHPPRR